MPVASPELVAQYAEVRRDLAAALATKEAQDKTMPGSSAGKNDHVASERLWDKAEWAEHRSMWRWVSCVYHWPASSILGAIKVPLLTALIFSVSVLTLNRMIASAVDDPGAPWWPRLTLPQTPLSLQASSIGLLLVFRTNQTHDRLADAQKVVGRLAAVAREVVEMLVLHVAASRTPFICLAIRHIALFGWAFKAQLRGESESFVPLARALLPAEEAKWLIEQPVPTEAILFRLRMIVGTLYANNELDKEVFKFIEDDLAKLSAIDSISSRLTTFPIPPSYHRHGSRAIILWIGALPFALEGKGHRFLETLCTVFITAFVVFGLDAISLEIEQPFDVLPLHEFAVGMLKEADGVLDLWCAMPADSGSGRRWCSVADEAKARKLSSASA